MPGGGGCSATGGLFVVFSLLCFVGNGEVGWGVFLFVFVFKDAFVVLIFWSVVLNSLTNQNTATMVVRVIFVVVVCVRACVRACVCVCVCSCSQK